MASINIITNITNGAGLQRDTEILKALLEAQGHTITATYFRENPTHRTKIYDLNIYLEVVNENWLRKANQNWLFPNSEWWFSDWDWCLDSIDLILCKTHDCQDIWRAKCGQRAVYTGFESADVYDPTYKKIGQFLHLAGKSLTKNTKMVAQAWSMHKLKTPLYVSAFKPEIMDSCMGISFLTLVNRYTPKEVVNIQNESWFHIMPSKYEGYGHSIHEALGCGGIVLTVDAVPMNTFKGIHRPCLIPVSSVRKMREARFYEVTPESIADRVTYALSIPEKEREEISKAARAGFLEERDFFRQTFKELVSENL